MKIFKDPVEMQEYLSSFRNAGKKVGYVPTLGALHEGHMSLVRKSNAMSDITVVSIFVNPTQFNEKTDLDKYPRTFDADADMLREENCEVLFYPSVEIVYPHGMDKGPDIDLKGMDKLLEGAFRPGHFDGVLQVVERLLELVKPDQLYMGQKDFQQFTLIGHMIQQLKIPTELVVCPIKREKNGLAMSSRNVRLTSKEREAAGVIYKTLNYVRRKFKQDDASSCIEYALNRLKSKGFKPEYFEIIDGKSLQEVKYYKNSLYIVACVAVWVGDVRLIDNKILKRS
jgi:pantoate--beta-alanine ligase